MGYQTFEKSTHMRLISIGFFPEFLSWLRFPKFRRSVVGDSHHPTGICLDVSQTQLEFTRRKIVSTLYVIIVHILLLVWRQTQTFFGSLDCACLRLKFTYDIVNFHFRSNLTEDTLKWMACDSCYPRLDFGLHVDLEPDLLLLLKSMSRVHFICINSLVSFVAAHRIE